MSEFFLSSGVAACGVVDLAVGGVRSKGVSYLLLDVVGPLIGFLLFASGHEVRDTR